MSVPECWINESGTGFIVRKGGVDWYLWHYGSNASSRSSNPSGGYWEARTKDEGPIWGSADTIMASVDDALAKMTVKEKK